MSMKLRRGGLAGSFEQQSLTTEIEVKQESMQSGEMQRRGIQKPAGFFLVSWPPP
jgi:hypothetical protein